MRVLVAPLTTGAGVDRMFGYTVAEEVRKSLEDFDATKSLEKDEINDALERFGLAYQILTPMQWTAIASQLNADLVIVGSADAADSGVQVQAMIIQSGSGEELPIPEFAVPGDGGSDAKEASRQIIEAFSTQIAYLETRDPPPKATSDAGKEDCRVWSAVVDNRSDDMVRVYAWPDGDVVELHRLSADEIQHRRGALLSELRPKERESISLKGAEPVLLFITSGFTPFTTGAILMASPRVREVGDRSRVLGTRARDLQLEFSCTE